MMPRPSLDRVLGQLSNLSALYVVAIVQGPTASVWVSSGCWASAGFMRIARQANAMVARIVASMNGRVYLRQKAAGGNRSTRSGLNSSGLQFLFISEKFPRVKS